MSEGAKEAVPAPAAVARLAELIRIPTVSRMDPSQEDPVTFAEIGPLLGRLWPRVAANLKHEAIGDRAFLYEWTGSDPSLAPVLLCAHFDVVPPGDEGSWTHPPFAGEIADGFLWGRGTQDVKVLLAAILESAEFLLGEGFAPRRTMYFAFGGDEEVGGTRGAARIAAHLSERGVRASFLLDEGGPVGIDIVPFVRRPVALVGVTEKGYVDIDLVAKGQGGHASMPPRHTAVGDLARAIADLEAHPFPTRLTKTLRGFLARLAPEAPPLYRFLFGGQKIFGPLLRTALSAAATTGALVRTTMAPTMLAGSDKENVLPPSAAAVLNVRILPGESSASVLERIAARVGRYGVAASFRDPSKVVEPARESSFDHEGFQAISAAVAIVFPRAIVAPFLFTAGTDTKHYAGVVEALYRFSAFEQTNADLASIHAVDERISLEGYGRCVEFYRVLMGGL